jgi:hypothetical protein
MAELIDRMLSMPDKTEAGRQAKADVAICCVLDWRDRDEQVGRRVKTTRRLLAGEAREEHEAAVRLILPELQRARRFTLAGFSFASSPTG